MHLAGVFAPLPTPFTERGDLDAACWRAGLRRWVTSQLTGFVVLGSTGEAVLLDDEECDRVVDEARSIVPTDRPLIVGTGRESTRAAVRASRRAAELGADAVLVRTPGFFKAQMSGEALIRHYETVADASPVPVLLYNFTAVTGVTIPPATVTRLARHPNIAGMKESGSDIGRITDLVTAVPRTFPILAGSGAAFFSARCAGVAGGILALAALLPEPCLQLFHLTDDRRYDDARELQHRLLPIARLISSSGVPGLKAALKIVGRDAGLPRLPLTPVSDTAVQALQEALARFEEVRA